MSDRAIRWPLRFWVAVAVAFSCLLPLAEKGDRTISLFAHQQVICFAPLLLVLAERATPRPWVHAILHLGQLAIGLYAWFFVGFISEFKVTTLLTGRIARFCTTTLVVVSGASLIEAVLATFRRRA